MIAMEKYARENWWCPARRNRNATTGATGYNMSIFPIKTQWKYALIAWMFPNYFWLTVGRHGKCVGSNCATWRWYEFKKTGWCGLAPRPDMPDVVVQQDSTREPANVLPEHTLPERIGAVRNSLIRAAHAADVLPDGVRARFNSLVKTAHSASKRNERGRPGM
jgi:hypothetical protein